MRSAQAKERRRPTLDSAGEASQEAPVTQAQARRVRGGHGAGDSRSPSEPRGSGRATLGAMLHAVVELPSKATKAAMATRTAHQTAGEPGEHPELAATEATSIVSRSEVPGGQLLRGARERRGLSIADVAKKTRIADRWITAIEEGRLDELPAPVFAIGYIRSYARTVGLEPGEIVERFRSAGSQRDDSFWGSLPDRSGATPRSLEQAAAKRKYILWTATFLLLGVAALVAAWLRSRR